MRPQQNYTQQSPDYSEVPPGMAKMYSPQQEYDTHHADQIQSYGSIIKDLTDTERIIEEFRLRVLGRMMVNGEERVVRDVPIDENAILDVISMIRGVVNQNTHFSKFDGKEVDLILKRFNYTICRTLMMQGAKIPKGYRDSISFQAMALVSASLHKAVDGNILVWTKGSFGDQRRMDGTPETKSFWSHLWRPGAK